MQLLCESDGTKPDSGADSEEGKHRRRRQGKTPTSNFNSLTERMIVDKTDLTGTMLSSTQPAIHIRSMDLSSEYILGSKEHHKCHGWNSVWVRGWLASNSEVGLATNLSATAGEVNIFPLFYISM
jgi:hypothetical protein